MDSDGSNIKPWYLPSEYPAGLPLPYGYSGVAALGDILLANDYNGGTDGQIYKFDMTADVGTPVLIPRTPNVTLVRIICCPLLHLSNLMSQDDQLNLY